MRRCLNCMSEYQDRFGETCPNCGYTDGVTLNGDVCLYPGTILQGRYIVGTVRKNRDNDIIYVGWDALFDRKVQIQEYFPRYCATRSSKTELSIYDSKKEQYEEGLKLFCSQSRELIRLYKDEDVITYHACFQENKTAYAIMDYREEELLSAWAERQMPGERESLTILNGAIRAADKAHKVGVCHGMIDMDTFWVTREGRLVLKDFGAWRYISGEPGVVNYGNAGIETDVYGLAKLFCRLVTGKNIEDGDNLEADLMRSKVSLDREVVAALKHALSHETKSLYRFREELGGQFGESAVDTFLKNRSKRRDAKESFSIPRWLYITAGALLAAAAVTAALMFTGVIQFHIGSGESRLEKNMVRVPNVVGKKADEAESILRRSGLEMSREKMEYSDEIAQDVISYQEIRENTPVEKGTTLVVWISKGKEKGVIPSVTGLPREEAQKLLAEAGFTNIKIQDSQEAGAYLSVLAVSEKQGENIELDKEIVLTVCMKEKETEGVLVKVPDVQGLDRSAVEAAVKEANLQVNWIEECSDDIPEGKVLAQKPEAGQEAEKDSYIDVRISTGPEKIYMKNVGSMTLEEAKAEIGNLGLSVGTVTEEYSDSVPSGKVISQSIAQDALAKKGEAVNLVVSRGKDPAKQPKATQAPKATKPASTNPPPTKPQATQPPTQSPPQTQPQESPTETAAETAESTSTAAETADPKANAITVGGGGQQENQPAETVPEHHVPETEPPQEAPAAPPSQNEVNLSGPPPAETSQEAAS